MRKCFQCINSKEACSSSLERIYAIQGTKKRVDSDSINVGCPWFINSGEHKYSFWEYAKTLDEPVSDKDICDLLLIDQNTLDQSYMSAIKKLRELKDSPELQDFKEALLLKINTNNHDNTVYLPDEFAVAAAASPPEEEKDQEAELFKDDKKKRRKGFGMPIHRDGKKVDIFFTSKKKAMKNKNTKKRS